MTYEKKKEFQRRLASCNSSGMIVIEFDIFFEYLKDANEAVEMGGEPFKDAIRHADAVLKRLQDTLDFKYDIATKLFPLYGYARQQLMIAMATKKAKPLSNANNVIKKIYEAFAKIAETDDSPPIMSNTQSVYAGVTYGKGSLNEGIGNMDGSRGFLA